MTTDLRDQLQSALGGAYAIERELGGGGMSRVFVATETALGRRVVVKVLPPEMSGALSAERFKREIQLVAQLRHPHIVPLLAAGEAGDSPPAGGPLAGGPPAGGRLLYYTMPYIEGESLRARLARQGELPVGEAVRLLREVADALACAHERGLVHRDVKPDNILLEHGHAVVADFGVAKALAAAADEAGGFTTAGLAVGTPAYMAPEQAAADPATDHRADLYAMGVVAYETLAGSHPFAGRPASALLLAHATEPPEPVGRRRPGVPPALAQLVARLLEKRPADRPQSAREVLRALDAVSTSGDQTAGASEGRVAAAERRPPGRRRVAYAAGLALALATAAVAFLARRDDRAARATDAPASGLPAGAAPAAAAQSIAVLPFDNLSPDPENAYFADGITEELTNALAAVEGLRVAARTSAFALKARRLDVRTIGDTLGVAAVLEGSVRRSGNRLRVAARLVNARDGYRLWSATYDRELRDVFQVQDEIARAIVGALRVRLAGGADTTLVRRPTESLEAYDLYLKGRYHWNKRSDEGFRLAIADFEQALAADPRYAPAYAGLADTYALLGFFSPPREAYPRAKAAALRALELDSTLAEAHTSLGFVRLFYDWDFAGAERSFRRAIALNPSYATAHQWFAVLLLAMGRGDEALVAARRARALDPLSVPINLELGQALSALRRHDEAIAQFRETMGIEPRFWRTHLELALAYLRAGQAGEAIAPARRAVEYNPPMPRTLATLAYAYAAAGMRDSAERLARELTALSRSRHVREVDLALVYAGLGDADRAIGLLEQGYAERTVTAAQLRYWFAGGLERDPRFGSLLRRAGLRP